MFFIFLSVCLRCSIAHLPHIWRLTICQGDFHIKRRFACEYVCVCGITVCTQKSSGFGTMTS